MDIKNLCLGVLTFGEASGYDIKKYFECSFSHFFVAGYGSIYPALGELADRGLVTCRSLPQDGKPDRKVYRITDTGREAFQGELERTPPRHKIRSEFFVLLYFSHLLPASHLTQVLDQRLRDVDTDLDMIDEFLRSDCDCPAGERFGAGLGKAVLEATRDYIERNRHMLFEDEPGAAGMLACLDGTGRRLAMKGQP